MRAEGIFAKVSLLNIYMRHFEKNTPTFVYPISPPSFSPGLKLTIIVKFQVSSVTMFTNSLFALFPLPFTNFF